MVNGYVIKHVKGHIEVYLNGQFLFSADNMQEVYEELKEMEHDN